MNASLLAAANDNGGEALLGFIIIVGIVWLICAAFSPKSKGWNIDSQTRVRPR